MKKSSICIILIVLIFAAICSCNRKATATWQEEYELAVHYLSEGSYEEAVLAFTTAIEIDSMQIEAYLGRAEVYVQLGEYELALEDYQTAIELDESNEEVYIKISELCLSMGEKEQAIRYIHRGWEITSSEALNTRLNELLDTVLYALLDTLSADSVTHEPFLTSEGTEFSPFPAEAYGWVSGTVLDLDGDGQKELLSLNSTNEGITLLQYSVDPTDGTVSETALGTLLTLGYCDQVDLILFYSQPLGRYSISRSDFLVGAYTGANGFTASLYTIEDSGVQEYQSWEWINLVHDWDMLNDVSAEMEAVGWPYMASYYFSIRDEESLASCTWLLHAEIEITEGTVPIDYVRYMRLLSPEELKSLSDSVLSQTDE